MKALYMVMPRTLPSKTRLPRTIIAGELEIAPPARLGSMLGQIALAQLSWASGMP